jgi:hypothetical protein
MRKNRKYLAVAALAAVVAGGGSAFTASLAGVDNFSPVIAEGVVDIEGATLEGLTYDRTDGDITSVTFVVKGHYDLASTEGNLSIGDVDFNCGSGAWLNVDNGVINVTNDQTQFTCTGAAAVSNAEATSIWVESDSTPATRDTNEV